MSQELLAIIEQIEREKGIKKEVLIQAVESAMLSAAKRVIDLKPDEEFKVEIDRNSGKIRGLLDHGRRDVFRHKKLSLQRQGTGKIDVTLHRRFHFTRHDRG